MLTNSNEYAIIYIGEAMEEAFCQIRMIGSSDRFPFLNSEKSAKQSVLLQSRECEAETGHPPELRSSG